MANILVTGACGQLGSELTAELRKIHGNERVVASDINGPVTLIGDGPYEHLDVMNKQHLEKVIEKYNIGVVYHLAAILSANSEKNIDLAWKLNIDGLLNVLQLAQSRKMERVFWPSSIAVFGPDAQKKKTPQNSPMNPTTVYGISKVAGEHWCAYFHRKFGVDVRSLRYPGLIGYKSLPGGGTTDYAVDIYHKAVAGEKFSCFLEKDSALPMMYMDDAVKAAIDLMNAPEENITIRTSYNVSAISFSPEEIATSIQARIPGFDVAYEPDYRQEIASSWPDSIDDSAARDDWGWKPAFDLKKMTADMLKNLPGVLEGM
ncbi:MAG: NAD-dependent epimerase/dehydratase family protein [Balneolaceae bacterium]|nr:MAG: NAD-dependent epimerase/dehydratase family protein [Balneolaceae bacterium]